MKYDSVTDIIILGEQCAGKTLFINNYLYNSTKTNNLIPTIGVDFYKKAIHYNNNNYLFKLWDTGNGLLYKNILEFYLRTSSIFIIISTEKNIKFIKEVFDIIHTD
jgi:small GTP-binding protein